MANIKLLQEAIQAFANGDSKVADKKMRKYFVEQAQEINKKLEEEMEVEDEICEEEELDEDIGGGEEEDLVQDVKYELEEGLFDGEEDGEFSPEGHEVCEAEDDFESDFEGEEEVEAIGDDAPQGDGWEDFKAAFEDLERIFDELNDDVDAGEEDVDVDVADDFDADEGEGEEVEDEFADIDFGDEKVGEAYKMKPVSAPSNDSAKGKSPVASNAKSPVDGVSPVKIKDGSVKVTGVGEKGGDAESYTTDDNDNVMDNAKSMMKPVKAPKNTAEKSASPLPKKTPKF